MTGVVFPQQDGQRSSSALGREVVAAALAGVDDVGADAVRRETAWRKDYPRHFRRLVEVGIHDGDAARTVARQGLEALHRRMRWVGPGGEDEPLARACEEPGTPLAGATIEGQGEPERELSLPYRGERLRGDELRRRLEEWVRAGVVEPGVQQAVERVLDHPEWLDLRDQRVVVLGAGAEMGPLRSILRWGGDVVGVDLARPNLWRRLVAVARQGAGRLVIPVPQGVATDETRDDDRLARHAGADLLHDLGAVAHWLESLDGPLVLGNYVYADGATNLRLATAVDALTTWLTGRRDDVALAFLATPTDAFVVPGSAVAQSTSSYDNRTVGRVVRTPLRVASGGRLLRRQYPPGEAVGVSDSIVEQQGPNYLLAKRVHRWRATVAAADGLPVSLNVAPPTRTRSVTKNRALAAAYAGAHWFGIEVFEPATSNTLMAALLVDDLRHGGGAGHEASRRPWTDEARAAVHGGLWRTGYDPRSALGVAALLGLGAARH
ncbi:hypothetical protein [Arsenicicoccus sp. oral taxon 190]|uniref:hypothetical protein n=1 Tax=Arsenicicoccus sp. oral taxon 190 TaxID=1658671 RepID=UPI00067A3A91|nr:hypothetical protein [Arsenicicoccus sp. oral taxon 190]AKT52580.1 hypothetical protein ADJ73_04100 [Arsenicicoccus sp. oral taxon 190]